MSLVMGSHDQIGLVWVTYQNSDAYNKWAEPPIVDDFGKALQCYINSRVVSWLGTDRVQP